MTNTRLEKIESTWNEFLKEPFPEDGASVNIAGDQELGYIDSTAAGCISTFIQASGRLDKQRYDCLKTCLKDLSIGIKNLDAGPVKLRVEQLHLLSKLVLEYVDASGGAG
ncbi:MAG: hypothetical protein C0469_03260 [Cyanobacteria bacterium DS2.3.42]|nr:hypothetical protein [Cyanobacteria bacterium DS2.3.42]